MVLAVQIYGPSDTGPAPIDGALDGEWDVLGYARKPVDTT
jgi:hypothetical protein